MTHCWQLLFIIKQKAIFQSSSNNTSWSQKPDIFNSCFLFGKSDCWGEYWAVVLNEFDRTYFAFIFNSVQYFSTKADYLFIVCSFQTPCNVLFPIITTTITFWAANIHNETTVYFILTAIYVIMANISVSFGMTFTALYVMSTFLVKSNRQIRPILIE